MLFGSMKTPRAIFGIAFILCTSSVLLASPKPQTHDGMRATTASAYPSAPMPRPDGGVNVASAYPSAPLPRPDGGINTASAYPSAPLPRPDGGVNVA